MWRPINVSFFLYPRTVLKDHDNIQTSVCLNMAVTVPVTPPVTAGTVSLHEVIPLLDAVSELEPLALYLGLSESAIFEVRSIPGGLVAKQIVLVSKWLQSDVKASWEKLATALFKMKHKVLSSKIRRKYNCGLGSTDNEEEEDPSSDKCKSRKHP